MSHIWTSHVTQRHIDASRTYQSLEESPHTLIKGGHGEGSILVVLGSKLADLCVNHASGGFLGARILIALLRIGACHGQTLCQSVTGPIDSKRTDQAAVELFWTHQMHDEVFVLAVELHNHFRTSIQEISHAHTHTHTHTHAHKHQVIHKLQSTCTMLCQYLAHVNLL